MKTKKLFFILLISTVQFTHGVMAQIPELKKNFSEDGKYYIKATFLNQAWLRYNQSNPGTMVLGEPTDETFDIGLRRTRMQLFGQLTDHLFFYTQFGMNNFNYLSANAGNRKLQAFFHDALAEYHVFAGQNYLKIGAGLTITNGLSRFSQPSIGSIMTLDVPVFAQATVDQTDEFSRKLSLYARGQLGRLDYRIALTDPFPITTSGASIPPINADATFASMGHHKQYQGLFIWNFFDKEPNTTPYMTGTYLGKKKVLNLEAGAIYQQAATWTSDGVDTSFHNMFHWSVAAFLDMPLNKEKGNAISAYAGFFSMDYGPNYVRNNGVMNPGQSTNANASFNGTGSAFPMMGTGTTIYVQLGYLMKQDLLKKSGTLMPYASMQYSQFNKLDDPSVVLDGGINWLIKGHAQKLSLGLQNRPVFNANTYTLKERKNMLVLQYQISI